MPDRAKYDGFSETTRREIYDAVVAIFFKADDSCETRTPDEAEVQVMYLWGRWLAVWRDEDGWSVLRVTEARGEELALCGRLSKRRNHQKVTLHETSATLNSQIGQEIYCPTLGLTGTLIAVPVK